MFVQTETTPNPNSLKFLPGKKVSKIGIIEITNKDETNNLRMTGIFGVVFCIINVILCIYAITIALKCAGNFITKMCNLIFAMCVPFLYIIYRLARPCV